MGIRLLLIEDELQIADFVLRGLREKSFTVEHAVDGLRGWSALESPPKAALHIFEPFYRAPDARRNGHEGVGLGLAVAQRIAGALGGSISVTSQVSRGSRLTLELRQIDRSHVEASC